MRLPYTPLFALLILLIPSLAAAKAEGGVWNLELTAGGQFQHREFKENTVPTVITGDSYTNFDFGIEVRKSFGVSMAIDAGLVAAPETLQPTNYNVAPDKQSVLFAQSWTMPEFSLGAVAIGAGLWLAPTYDFSFSGTSLVVNRTWRTGVATELMSGPRWQAPFLWRLQFGIVGTGSTGIDFRGSIRKGFTARKGSYFSQQGAFVQLTVIDRSFSVESTYGGALELGIAF